MKILTFKEMRKCHQDEVNNFQGIFFAFSDEQFATGLRKLNTDMYSISSMGAGGYILKERIPAWNEMVVRHEKEMKELRKNEKELLNALIYELNNHEYSYSLDPQPALEALMLKKEDIPAAILDKAIAVVMMDKIY